MIVKRKLHNSIIPYAEKIVNIFIPKMEHFL